MVTGTVPSADSAGPRRPGYVTTVALAAALLGLDGLLTGQGILSLFVLGFGVPLLLLRALATRRNPALRRRRLASVGIYFAAAVATIVLVGADMRGARARAKEVIAACEAFKSATGRYPASLAELTPTFLTTIPVARRLGWAPGGFSYSAVGGPGAPAGTSAHRLRYVAIPPFGMSYYAFEEGRWGFLD
jgi:hypothetical protein